MSKTLTVNCTFLYTDIEGSTQLWERYPAAMKIALARHDALLREAIESHHGSVFKIIGDAFCAVFPAAPDALAAALAAQRALHAQAWGETPIKVRMAIHSGEAETRDGDYFGPMFNRLARLLSAGHGGQTLLSAAAYELLQDSLPDGAELRDMGERRLKDLIRPEHIYQVLVSDLPAQFPPLKTQDAFRTNLSAQLTSFIGREKEISEVKRLVKTNRLSTLVGAGGAGKTRLSLQVAAELLDSFLDGVWFVKFAPLTDPSLVTQTVITTIGLRSEANQASFEMLSKYLGSKKVLLVLDNCEHVIETAAQLAESLLETCPNVCLLVTSREALDISGEVVYRVPSLSVPDLGKPSSVETLIQYESTRLFIDRAQAALYTFTVMNTNAPAIAQICSRLDGIPLAIELAAARVRLLEVDQIAERLDNRFDLLTGGSRTALPRQQTLRALIDWSYDLLPDVERVLLRRLSVFAGGWTFEAAEAVCRDADVDSSHMLDLLTQLVNKSLVLVDADNVMEETRYRMLETIRQYAHEKLSNAGEFLQFRDRHLEYFLQLAERAEPELSGPRVVEWLQRLEMELDNLRTALEWSSKHNVLFGLRLASALMWFWQESIHTGDGRNWLTQLLEQPEAQPHTIIRARALGVLSHILIRGSSAPPNQAVRPILQESLALCHELGDSRGVAFGLLLLGLVSTNVEQDHKQGWQFTVESLNRYRELGDDLGVAWALTSLGGCIRMPQNEMAYSYLEEGLQIFRRVQHLAGLAHILMHLGETALSRGNQSTARAWFEEALEIQRQLGKGGYTLRLLGLLSEVAFQLGDYIQAQAAIEESLSVLEQVRSDNYWYRIQLGFISLRQDNIPYARRFFQESLLHFNGAGDMVGIVRTMEGFASLAVLQSQFERAARLFTWADVSRETFKKPRPPDEQAEMDPSLVMIRAQLGEANFAAAQAAGRAMHIDQAIADVLQGGDE